jgi:hypothetical protein
MEFPQLLLAGQARQLFLMYTIVCFLKPNSQRISARIILQLYYLNGNLTNNITLNPQIRNVTCTYSSVIQMTWLKLNLVYISSFTSDPSPSRHQLIETRLGAIATQLLVHSLTPD